MRVLIFFIKSLEIGEKEVYNIKDIENIADAMKGRCKNVGMYA